MTIDYGTDISTTFVTETIEFPDGSVRTQQTFDAADMFAEVSGRALLIEALIRRLVTRRGSLMGDPDYGTDVRAYVNKASTAAGAAALAAGISAELAKDERVKSASATSTFVNNTLTVAISLVDAAGPFKLTLAVSDVSLKLLGVTT